VRGGGGGGVSDGLTFQFHRFVGMEYRYLNYIYLTVHNYEMQKMTLP